MIDLFIHQPLQWDRENDVDSKMMEDLWFCFFIFIFLQVFWTVLKVDALIRWCPSLSIKDTPEGYSEWKLKYCETMTMEAIDTTQLMERCFPLSWNFSTFQCQGKLMEIGVALLSFTLELNAGSTFGWFWLVIVLISVCCEYFRFEREDYHPLLISNKTVLE